ncbi:MAG: HNH endonuclease signature motif containing protein [Candidatus Binatia bacterium]
MESSPTSIPFEDLDVVDPALLIPPDSAIHGGWRTDAGVVLDRELVALSGMHARCRLLQARLVRSLIERRGWRVLGFVRLGDYARERLGMAPRTLEDDARVLRSLDATPILAVALESGAIPWSRVRVLVRIATASNETRLLAESAPIPLRELDAFVRGFAQREQATQESEVAGSAQPSASSDSRVSEPTDAILRNAHAADALSPASISPASISTDAESTGSNNDPQLRWGITISRSGRRMWRAVCEMASRMEGCPLSPGGVLERVAAESSGEPAGNRWAPPPELHEQRLRDRLHQSEQRGRLLLRAYLAETGVAEGFAWLDPASRDPGPARHLDGLLDKLEHADAFEVDRRLRLLRRAAQRIDFQMTALLHIGINRRLFREIGFASVKLYVESRLGCSARTVWSMVAVERESWRRSLLLREAWRDGCISHLAAAALLPIISPSNAEEWIRRAGEVTLRRLQDEVAWALDHGQAPSSITRSAPPPPGADLRADGTADVDPLEVQIRAHGPASDASLGPAGAVRIECSVPLSVAVMVESTLDHLQRDGEARWQVFERMVACALLEWTRQPRHRDPVFERDGWRCSVPGCSSRRNLHDHHLQFRSHGGDNRQDNRTTVCAAHHLHGIHAGIVRATGRAPSRIVWELGCARGRRPWMRLFGDRFAEAA